MDLKQRLLNIYKKSLCAYKNPYVLKNLKYAYDMGRNIHVNKYVLVLSVPTLSFNGMQIQFEVKYQIGGLVVITSN